MHVDNRSMLSTNGSTRTSRHSIVPRGCVIGTVLLIVGVAIAGYFGYSELEKAFGVPLELESFNREDSVRAAIASKRAAPGSSARLDREWIDFYVDGVVQTGKPLLDVRDVLDSLDRGGRRNGDTGMSALLTNPAFYRTVTVVQPMTKRAMVNYLNAVKRSLDEYTWAKTRVIAATDITRESIDSSLSSMIGSHFTAIGSKLSFTSRNTDRFFEHIDSLRRSGAITAEERALARPIRNHLLRRGLGSLYGLDTDF